MKSHPSAEQHLIETVPPISEPWQPYTHPRIKEKVNQSQKLYFLYSPQYKETYSKINKTTLL
jgi:hypothetical protein